MLGSGKIRLRTVEGKAWLRDSKRAFPSLNLHVFHSRRSKRIDRQTPSRTTKRKREPNRKHNQMKTTNPRFNDASHLNTVDATTATQLNQNPLAFWPDEAWDSEGNHWVQDQSGWHWHCRNQSCTEFTRKENWHGIYT